jgi:hypothetical protein
LDQVLPLVVSFLLTTVLGALIGWYLQQRSWERQNSARLREDELRRAGELCQVIGELLDKRRYRMLRLLWTLEEFARGEAPLEVVEKRRFDYDCVLYEYNDRLNVNLSLMGTYFGAKSHSWLESRIYDSFVAAGMGLTRATKAVLSQKASAPKDLESARLRLKDLNKEIFQLNLYMMSRLRDGRVGREADAPLDAGSLSAPTDAVWQ